MIRKMISPDIIVVVAVGFFLLGMGLEGE